MQDGTGRATRDGRVSCSPARGAAPAARPGLSFPSRSARDRGVAAGSGRYRSRDAPPRPLGRLASGAAASLRNARSLRFLLPRVGGRVHRGTPVLGHGAGRPFRRSLALRGFGARRELGSVSPPGRWVWGWGTQTCPRTTCRLAEPPHAQPGRIGAAPIMGWGAGGSCTPRPPIHQQPAPETRVIAVVFLGLLLDLLAFTLLLPLLPALLESHGRAQVSTPGPDAASPPMAVHCSKPLRDSLARHTSLCPRILFMARGSAGWTGLLQPLGCQPRRGTTASCSEVWFLSRGWGPIRVLPSWSLPSQSQVPVLIFSLLGTVCSFSRWAVLGPSQLKVHGLGVQGPAWSDSWGLGSVVTVISVSSRSDWLHLLLPAVPLSAPHGGRL